MARHFKGTGVVLRFIEFMDVGTTNGWNLAEVLPSADLQRMLHQEFGLEPLEPSALGETAERWRYADGSGEVGLISSVTQAFCSDCTRARLSTDGRLFLCLFAQSGHDLRSLLRSGASDLELESQIAQIWQARTDRYSELRAQMATPIQRPEMSYIGG
jgi:GTP 3',8-cyclase